MRVLLTGARAPATLDLARILARRAELVLVADSVPLPLSALSRHVKRAPRLPPPRQAPERFRIALRELVSTYRITHLIPTCEEIFTVVQDETWLRDHLCLFAPDHGTLLRLHSKSRFQRWISELGLRALETTRFTSRHALTEHVTREGARCVYKPEWSRFAVKVRIAPEDTAWVDRERCDEHYPWLAQERAVGREWCSYSWFAKGQLIAHCNYPMAFASGAKASVVFSHQPHPEIESWVREFGRATGYTGQIAFDLIEDVNGLCAVECNPRLTSGVHTLIEANLAGLLLELSQTTDLTSDELRAAHLNDQDTPPPIYGSASPQALKSALLVYAPQEIKSRGLSAWLDALIRSRDVLIRWRDPIPGLLWPLSYLYFVWIAWREGISTVEASTFDIEWSSEAPEDEKEERLTHES